MQGYNSNPLDKLSSENGLRMRHPFGRKTDLLMNYTKEHSFLSALKLIYNFFCYFFLYNVQFNPDFS